MRVITEYHCEICGQKYTDADSAIACESRGVFDYSKCWPRGMIYATHTPGALYENITLAVAAYGANDEQGRNGKHTASFCSWACRDKSPHGDSLYGEMCGSMRHDDLGEYHAVYDTAKPCFARMVEYLKNNKIPVTVWDGARPVPYAEWLNTRTEPARTNDG